MPRATALSADASHISVGNLSKTDISEALFNHKLLSHSLPFQPILPS